MDENFIFNKNSYVSFDGTSLRDIIVDRLNKGKVFTDQNYEGSNLAAIIDVISYTFSNLLFYLNKTSTESLFSESQIYENMNRIVKLLNYKPLGPQAQTVPIRIIANGLSKGNYIIPRYSYVTVGATSYSFNEDVSISKNIDITQENISDINDKYSISQGLYEEYPLYIAAGIDNEKIYLAVDDQVFVDYFNIHVYVKEYNTNTWQRWTKVAENFLHETSDTVYEVRYNENKRYEITFGDNINGKKLENGDEVAIYYLRTNPNLQSLGIGALNGSFLTTYNSLQFVSILNDTDIDFGNYLNTNTISTISLTNEYPSTEYSAEETVEDIRKNAPKNFRTQYRLITLSDYEIFVKTNFSNFLADIKILTNEEYLRQHIKYLYNLGLNYPQEDTKILFNQIKFATSCNFNNLYLYVVPNNNNQEYLTPAQKEIILDSINQAKTVTSQIVPIDPVYMYVDFYLKHPTLDVSVNDIAETKLLIIKNENTKRSSSAISLDIKNIFDTYFSRQKSKLGQLIDIYQITNDILNIEGVDNVQTKRSDANIITEGISFLIWNPTYFDKDLNVYSQNIIMDNFKYPIFNNLENILDRIEIVEKNNQIKLADF
jgi:hypothetical protein